GVHADDLLELRHAQQGGEQPAVTAAQVQDAPRPGRRQGPGHRGQPQVTQPAVRPGGGTCTVLAGLARGSAVVASLARPGAVLTGLARPGAVLVEQPGDGLPREPALMAQVTPDDHIPL